METVRGEEGELKGPLRCSGGVARGVPEPDANGHAARLNSGTLMVFRSILSD
jgi:hypothetical protein